MVHDYNWLCINSTMYKKGKGGGINCVSQCGQCIVARATHKQFIQASDKIFISTLSAGTYNNASKSKENEYFGEWLRVVLEFTKD